MRHGFLLVHKPEGPTSHDIVYQIRRVLSEKKVGHLGTLDPAASGLLVLAVGAKALKVVELFTELTKEYNAGIRFGAVSTTYDREGTLEEFPRKPGVEDPLHTQIQTVLADRFVGKIEQVPPAYSAVKIGGERAYRKMRQGRGVDLTAREVHIDSCQILSYTYPDLVLKVACGSGTYIRSLAHDLGQMLRVGGYLSSLERTKVGDWKLEDAVKPEVAKWSDVLPLKEILKDYPRLDVSEEEALALSQGKTIPYGIERGTIAWANELPIALLLKVSEGESRARKVF